LHNQRRFILIIDFLTESELILHELEQLNRVDFNNDDDVDEIEEESDEEEFTEE
jgi:hypothetical protein